MRRGKIDNWSLVDVKEYDMLMQFHSTVKVLRDLLSRKVYKYLIKKLQNVSVCRFMMDGDFQICQMRCIGKYLVGLGKLLLLTD